MNLLRIRVTLQTGYSMLCSRHRRFTFHGQTGLLHVVLGDIESTLMDSGLLHVVLGE